MENPTSGDYIEVKKRKQMEIYNPLPESSAYITNKQYLTIQTTATSDEEGCLIPSERYNIKLPSKDLATLWQPKRPVYPMFSIKK